MAAPPAAPVRRRRWRRLLAWTLGTAVTIYVGIIGLLLLFENALLFHPVRASEDWLAPPVSGVRDVDLSSADGTRLHAWWCPREGAESAVLFCHGNAGNLSHRGDGIARWQLHLGASVLVFDYPGYGKSDGRPSEAGCYAAADAAYDWLVREAGVTPHQIVVFGESLGGAVAVDLASRKPHRALVLQSTFSSIPDMAQQIYPWLPARWLVRNRFDSLAKIGRCTRPVFVAHGDCDTIVPFAQGRRLFEAANEPKRFLPMPGCDHNDRLKEEFYREAAQFIAETAPAPVGDGR